MSSRNRKCLVASSLLHGLLLALLVFGPAFAPVHHVPEDLPILTVIPSRLILTDEKAFGGGGPAGPAPTPRPTVTPTPPAPKPVAPESKPAPPEPKPALPEPKKPATKETAPEPDTKNPTPHEITPSLKVIKRSTETKADTRQAKQRAQEKARQTREAQARQEQARAAYRQWQSQVDSAIEGVAKNLSGRTSIEAVGLDGGGFGGSGPAYANYGQYVISRYNNSWVRPEETTDSTLKVRVKVVVARDGTVISDEIVSRSGHAAFDRSVQRALERVRSLPPFPDGAKDSVRTYYFNFCLLPKPSILG